MAAVVMGAVMAGGFLTFGSASQGLILNSYATSDPLAFVARLGIAASIIFSYPLNFVGLREGILAFVGKTEEGKKNSVHVGLTLAIMLVINGSALFLKVSSPPHVFPLCVRAAAILSPRILPYLSLCALCPDLRPAQTRSAHL